MQSRVIIHIVRFDTSDHETAGSLRCRMEDAIVSSTTLIGTNVLDAQERKRVYRCARCNLVQFGSRESKCRRCCSRVLKSEHEAGRSVFPKHLNSLTAVKRLGHQIRALREGRGISRKELSLLLLAHVSLSYVYRIESGCTRPSLETLMRIAAILNVPLGAFFLDPDSPETLVYSTYFHEVTPLLKCIPDSSFETILSFVRWLSGNDAQREAKRRRRSMAVTSGAMGNVNLKRSDISAQA
jgi:transcriptional regulator with XRE-family HTH domain